MTQRQQFEADYIAKHFGEALRLEEMQYRDALEWVMFHRLGNVYVDEEINKEWKAFQMEVLNKAIDEFHGMD